MPEKTNVSLVFRIAREDGAQELTGSGQLHRMATGWAVTARLAEPSGDPDQSAAVSEMTLIIRDDEIRMNRKGAVSQEQIFSPGVWRTGTVGTMYGEMSAEARARGIRSGLTARGGRVEWEYDMRMMDQEFGRVAVTLDIREEDAE